MKRLSVCHLFAALAALPLAGCLPYSYTPQMRPADRPADRPVAEVSAIDAMTGEQLTEKREFVKDGYTLRYRLHQPSVAASEGDKAVRYPLVLFLHGAGERGDDNTRTLVQISYTGCFFPNCFLQYPFLFETAHMLSDISLHDNNTCQVQIMQHNNGHHKCFSLQST